MSEHWPLFGLRIRTPRLELRPPTDEDLPDLAAASADIHDPSRLPFMVPWSLEPSPRRERSLYQFIWRHRAGWGPESWQLPLAVFVDGVPIGVQGVGADEFSVRRSVATGSWLRRDAHGHGIGTDMCSAVLHFAFAELGAEEATSEAWDDNPSSQQVSAKVGYRENGRLTKVRQGEPREQVQYRMLRADWAERRRDDVEVEGLDGLLSWFGAQPPDGTWWPVAT